MRNIRILSLKKVGLLLIFAALFVSGCGPAEQKPLDLEAPVDLNTTVGALIQFVQYNAVPVRGFGIVAGLNGTGSSECPPALQVELEKYIRQQLPKTKGLSPRQFIESPDTAVVEINGTIPPLARQGQTFDVQVLPLSRTQTTSLDGGYLYTALLKERSIFLRYDQYSKTFATAQGQLFRNTLDDTNTSSWYLLGGGIVQNQVQLSMALRQPNFSAANAIRNRINERFGTGVARAISSAEVQLNIPPRFQNQKDRFLRMVQLLYLSPEPALQQQYIQRLIQNLSSQDNKEIAEWGLEAIGKPALDSLVPLLSSSDPVIRFHAARCMTNIGDERASLVLEQFCRDSSSPYCIPAIETIGQSMRPRKAEPILLRAAGSSSLDVRLAAYRQLELMNSPSISRNLVADSFVVDRVFCGGEPMIYVFRKDVPKITLFTSPIQCAPDIFIQSGNGDIILNARSEDKYIAVSRRHPARPRVIGPIQSGRELSMLIRALGENSEVEKSRGIQPGLSIPYQEILPLLKLMSEYGAVNASFQAGPMTEAGAFLENLPQNDR